MIWLDYSLAVFLDSFAEVEFALDLAGQEWLQRHADSVLDAVVDAIITIDRHGLILSHNQATERLFGYAPGELTGQPVTCLMPEPHRSRHQDYVRNYLETGNARIIGIGRELDALRKDGTTFPIYLAVNAIETDGEIYFVGIIRDLTEQVAAQRALMEQKDRAAHVGRLSTMGEMTASIAHEINQPLTAIAMYAQACVRLLKKESVDQLKVLDAIQKLNEQSLRAGAVIERIQRFVQNAGSNRAFVDLNTLLLDINHLAAGDARLHGVMLQFDLEASLPEVFADGVQIQQVALNLVRNAIDAMFEIECRHGDQLLVRSYVRGDNVIVEVVDTGTGVARDQADKLFTAFHSTKKEGMGMGLAICRSIIEDHDGELGFRNNEGPGATFYFSLPFKLEE